MTITTYRKSRPRTARVARFRLDVAEWLVLRSALPRRVAGATTPAAFDPAAFGLDASSPLSEDERRLAWGALQHRGLATTVPPVDDPAALLPAALPGLALLVEADVRVDVQGWSGPHAVTQAVAWSQERTAALTRRRRRSTHRGPDGADLAVARQEPVVELSLSSGGPVHELFRALPPSTAAGGPVNTAPVELGWRESAAVADALRAGREDVATHLAGLTPHTLGVLGAVSAAITGGATMSGRRRRGEEVLAFRRVWLWTETDIIELVTATEQSVTLRRTDPSHLRTDLLATLTGLAHATDAA